MLQSRARHEPGFSCMMRHPWCGFRRIKLLMKSIWLIFIISGIFLPMNLSVEYLINNEACVKTG